MSEKENREATETRVTNIKDAKHNVWSLYFGALVIAFLAATTINDGLEKVADAIDKNTQVLKERSSAGKVCPS